MNFFCHYIFQILVYFFVKIASPPEKMVNPLPPPLARERGMGGGGGGGRGEGKHYVIFQKKSFANLHLHATKFVILKKLLLA